MNPFRAFSSSATTSSTMTHLRQSDMDCPQFSQFSISDQMDTLSPSSVFLTPTTQLSYLHQDLPPFQNLQLPSSCSFDQASQSFCYAPPSSSDVPGIGVQSNSFPSLSSSPNHEGGDMDSNQTKVARKVRKLARQRILSGNRCSSLPSSSSNFMPASATQKTSSRFEMFRRADKDVNTTNTVRRDLYQFCTPDNRRLRLLVTKELKNSDVGSLGRIVLPKREVEENLPYLSFKEGIQVIIRDVQTTKLWSFRYKFWLNNKSRMYVLENTGDFIKQNGLESGDFLAIFEDENKNLYLSSRKCAIRTPTQHYANPNAGYYYQNYCQTYQGSDEEQVALAELMEQLTYNELQHAKYRNITNLPTDSGTSNGPSNKRKQQQPSNNNVITTTANLNQFAAEPMEALPSQGKGTDIDDDYQEFTSDDFYHSLGMLPDVNRYII